MALVACPDCSAQVSDAALACPTCGRPLAPVLPRRSTLRRVVMGSALAVFLAAFAWLSFTIISARFEAAAQGHAR